MFRKLIASFLGLILVILFFQLFFRYRILSSEGRYYKYDRLTGKFMSLEPQEKAKDLRNKAIQLAKISRLGSSYAEPEIQNRLSTIKGVDIKGWKAEPFDSNTYLVSCTYVQGKTERGWWWEVNLNANVVRPVIQKFRGLDLFDLEWISGEYESPKGVIVDSVLVGRYNLISQEDWKTLQVLKDSIPKK